jgi:tetratricopeptide (TPR) repeat protein
LLGCVRQLCAAAFAAGAAVAIGGVARGEEPAALLDRAGAAYKGGAFASAAASYEALRSAGLSSADLDFNLGNAYAKAGDLGRAIASYERARLRAPRDRDLLENLALTREQCVDRPPAGAMAAFRFVEGAAARLTPDEWAALLCASYVALLGAILAPRFGLARPAPWRHVRSAAAVALIASAVGLGAWHETRAPDRRAAVVAPEVTIRSGPGTNYLGEFSLHAGSVVRIEGRRGEWTKIAFSPSLRGWTESVGLEGI